jgi:hypothetical protein
MLTRYAHPIAEETGVPVIVWWSSLPHGQPTTSKGCWQHQQQEATVLVVVILERVAALLDPFLVSFP